MKLRASRVRPPRRSQGPSKTCSCAHRKVHKVSCSRHGCQPGPSMRSGQGRQRLARILQVLTIRRRDPWPDGFPRGSIWIWGGLRYTNLRTFPDTLIFKSTASRFTQSQSVKNQSVARPTAARLGLCGAQGRGCAWMRLSVESTRGNACGGLT